MPADDENYPSPSTLAVWGGEDRPFQDGSITPPIVMSAPFAHPDMDSWRAVSAGHIEGLTYSRSRNPTVGIFEEKCRLLERGEHAIAFASGMAAITNSLSALLTPGDRVVTISDLYGGTGRFLLEYLEQTGITVDFVDAGDGGALQRSMEPGCRLVYAETPTNPTMKISDLRAMAAAAKQAGALTLVDNTLASPINQRPLDLGIDLVVHSATKYLSGHDDVLGGVLVGERSLVDTVYRYREIHGACLAPHSAYLLLRGMKTLSLRMERHNSNALGIARWLHTRPEVAGVFYPGLPEHPGHDVACQQMQGFGGVLSFSLHGDRTLQDRFVNALRYAHRASSIGSVSTLVGPPETTSHQECSTEQRQALGIPSQLLRYSTGIEDLPDLLADIEQALAAAGA